MPELEVVCTFDQGLDSTNHVMNSLLFELNLLRVLPISYLTVSTSPVVDAICQIQLTLVGKLYADVLENWPKSWAKTWPFLIQRFFLTAMYWWKVVKGLEVIHHLLKQGNIYQCGVFLIQKHEISNSVGGDWSRKKFNKIKNKIKWKMDAEVSK